MKKITPVYVLVFAAVLGLTSCTKKDDTTSTTTSTSTTTGGTTPKATLNRLVVDGVLTDKLGCNWDAGQGGQYDLIAGLSTPSGTIGLGAIFSPEPTSSRELTVTISVPNPDPSSVHLYYRINDTQEFVAQGGKADLKVVHFGVPVRDSLYMTFESILFKRLGTGTHTISGYLGFQGH